MILLSIFVVSSLKCYTKNDHVDGLTDCSGMAGEMLADTNGLKKKVGDVEYCYKIDHRGDAIKGCGHDRVVEDFKSVGLWGPGCVNLEDGKFKFCLCSTDGCNSSHKLKISITMFTLIFMFMYAMNL